MNYNYLYIFIYFLFTESRILRFTIRFYNSIREILPTIQDRIPILITLDEIGSKLKPAGQIFFRYGFGTGRVRSGPVPVRVEYGPGPVRYGVSQNGVVEGKSQTLNIFFRFFSVTRSLLCNASLSLSLHRRFSHSHFLLYRRRATDCSFWIAYFLLSISSLLSIQTLLYGLLI